MVLDYLRSGKLILPDNFTDIHRFREEAVFYKLSSLANRLARRKSGDP